MKFAVTPLVLTPFVPFRSLPAAPRTRAAARTHSGPRRLLLRAVSHRSAMALLCRYATCLHTASTVYICGMCCVCYGSSGSLLHLSRHVMIDKHVLYRSRSRHVVPPAAGSRRLGDATLRTMAHDAMRRRPAGRPPTHHVMAHDHAWRQYTDVTYPICDAAYYVSMHKACSWAWARCDIS